MLKTARIVSIALVSIALGLIAIAGVALAQPYPSKPIKIVVSTSPGGITDILARFLGSHITYTKFGTKFRISSYLMGTKRGLQNR
jgi:tripartite-type tricarboxylate transporter receptor subunit TctC